MRPFVAADFGNWGLQRADLGLRKTRDRGRGLVEWFFLLAAAAYNLIRIPKILAELACALPKCQR
jgi:hypothetical protein